MEPSIDYSKFAKNLNDLAAANKINMAELGRRTGITPATLSRYSRNLRDPELAYVITLAQYFGVTVDWLIGLTEDKIDDDVNEIARAYRVASASDKIVVNAVLEKYKDM